MDPDTAELVARLGTRIGMIMEDTSPIALTLHTRSDKDRSRMIDELITASDDIMRLTNAIDALR